MRASIGRARTTPRGRREDFSSSGPTNIEYFFWGCVDPILEIGFSTSGDEREGRERETPGETHGEM